MRCYFNLCRKATHFGVAFSEAHLHCADTFFASARPVVTGETATKRNGQARSLQGCGAKLNSALALREARTVSTAPSTPGTGNHRIRSCPNSLLKILDRDGAGV